MLPHVNPVAKLLLMFKIAMLASPSEIVQLHLFVLLTITFKESEPGISLEFLLVGVFKVWF